MLSIVCAQELDRDVSGARQTGRNRGRRRRISGLRSRADPVPSPGQKRDIPLSTRSEAGYPLPSLGQKWDIASLH